MDFREEVRDDDEMGKKGDEVKYQLIQVRIFIQSFELMIDRKTTHFLVCHYKQTLIFIG